MTSFDDLVKKGRIEAVEADVAAAKDKLKEAKRHLASATAIADDDPEGAYSLVYDAARKAVDAHMLANGYRTSKSKLGAHEATARYVEAVIGGEYASDARAFNRMRKEQNRTEYGIWHISSSTLKIDSVHAARIVEAVEASLES
ncbi:MAG: hypothetical protein ACRDJV_00810 [Actinomycetota bacterium]